MLAEQLLPVSALVFPGGFLFCFPSGLFGCLLQYKPKDFLSSCLCPGLQLVFLLGCAVGGGVKRARGAGHPGRWQRLGPLSRTSCC